jgi:anthranilate synthase component 1
MDFSTFQSLASAHNVIPVSRTMLADTLTPVSAFLRIREGARAAFLFESVEGNEQIARYSFIGRDPAAMVRSDGASTTVTERGTERTTGENFFAVLAALTTGYRSAPDPALPRFTGGWVGYIGYDAVRFIERLPERAPRTHQAPDSLLGLFATVLAFDHRKHQISIIANVIAPDPAALRAAYDGALRQIDAIEALLRGPEPARAGRFAAPPAGLVPETPREEFLSMVRTAKQHITEGDIFQVVLSQRFSAPYEGDDFNVYRALRVINPSPYLYYLMFDDVRVIGSSPEVLVRKEGSLAETFPIAGTRPRGATDAQDAALEAELLADAKERAEHVMLVDLGRNDLGRVAALGTVAVDHFMEVVRYSHVMHIASRVRGVLPESATAVDVLRAAFPAGTVSGAPKIRAMEIIDELERSRRGLYAGGVGYFDFSGNMDMCIAIRTLVASGGVMHLQAGAGIVADSDPAAEYQETINKSRALVEALAAAGRIEP